MTNVERRAELAARVRSLGHAFVTRVLDDDELDELTLGLDAIAQRVRQAPRQTRTFSTATIDAATRREPRRLDEPSDQLFANSFVAGSANPLGLGATLRRDGDVVTMNVVLGDAFEGAPARAHGGVVAALVDEAMGLVLVLQGVLAFTVRLDISYLAPTPLNEQLEVRSWLSRREGRKLFVEAEVHANDTRVASASAVFITVNPATFAAHEPREA